MVAWAAWGCGRRGGGGAGVGEGAYDVAFADGAGAAAGGEPGRADGRSVSEREREGEVDLHALGVEFVAAGKAHDTALAVDVLF